jgi:ABC-2 type transport system permease protein
MERFKTLMLREWLQHRLGWTLLAGIPLALMLLVAAFGELAIEADGETGAAEGRLAEVVTLIATLAGGGLLLIVMTLTSLLLMSNLARRDHGDRANEFWHSLPIPHLQALTAPLLVHLLLVPLAALALGLLGGWLISAVVVARMDGLGAWLTQPWGAVLTALGAVALRLAAGLPLALLWLAPLLLLVIVAQAWLRRWGLVAVLAGGGVLATVLEQGFQWPMLRVFVGELLAGAGRSVTFGIQADVNSVEDFDFALAQVPGWAGSDLAAAVQALASPWFAAGLVMAAGLFAALLDWRRRHGAAA